MDPVQVQRDLMAADPAAWKAAAPEFQALVHEKGCLYGDRPIVKVMRPKVLSSGDYAWLDYVSGTIMRLYRRLEPMVLESDELKDYLGLTPEERELVAYTPRCPDPAPFTRLDSFQTAEGPRFVELNGECPAGPGFVDRSVEVFQGHPLTAGYLEKIKARTFLCREGLMHGLLTAWRASGGNGIPSILITDYLDLPTVAEFHMIADYLNARGVPTVVEDPRHLDYKDGKLWAKGRPIDLIYRRVLTNEFLERRSELQALEKAYADQAVVVVNPFRAKAIHKKASFALLGGDVVGQDWMTAEERAVVKATIPWTRKVREGKTHYDEQEVDLVPVLLKERERFVIKPNDDYGGRGITLGWETDDATWEEAVREACGQDHVAQERVWTLQEPFPMLEDDLQETNMIVDLDPYVYFGRVHGVLARLAAGSLCNVTSGGGQVPVVLADIP